MQEKEAEMEDERQQSRHREAELARQLQIERHDRERHWKPRAALAIAGTLSFVPISTNELCRGAHSSIRKLMRFERKAGEQMPCPVTADGGAAAA